MCSNIRMCEDAILSLVHAFADVGRPGLRSKARARSLAVTSAAGFVIDAANDESNPDGERHAVMIATSLTPMGIVLRERVLDAISNQPDRDITVEPLFSYFRLYVNNYGKYFFSDANVFDAGAKQLEQYLWAACIGYGKPGARLPPSPIGMTEKFKVIPSLVKPQGDDDSQSSAAFNLEPRSMRY